MRAQVLASLSKLSAVDHTERARASARATAQGACGGIRLENHNIVPHALAWRARARARPFAANTSAHPQGRAAFSFEQEEEEEEEELRLHATHIFQRDEGTLDIF